MFSLTCGIYAITSPSGKRYVGQSSRLANRWLEHKSRLRRGVHPCRALQRAAVKYGVEALRFEVLANCFVEHLGAFEREIAERLKPEYNSGAYGPSTTLGIIFGPEVRARMGKAQTGLKRGPYTEKHKAAISVSKKGKPRPDMLKFDLPVRCVETGRVFENASTAERLLGKRPAGNILKACRGDYATAYGFHWEF